MIRKTLVLTVALFALIVASAEAHTITIAPACGSVTINWENFNDGNNNNSLNGGQNTVTYVVSYTLGGQPTVTLPSAQTSFGNEITDRGVVQHTVTVSPLPHANGTVTVTSFWTADQTSDGDAETVTQTAQVSGCVNQPMIVTQATPTTQAVGQPISDRATLSGGFMPTGSITWRLYGPNDPACSNPNAPSVTITDVNGDGSYPSPSITPTVAGTYFWVATYDGDANNNSFTGSCSDANEKVIITPLTPGLTTTATPTSIVLGGSITDQAILTGGHSPTGTITWKLYGPNDATCSGTPQTTSAVAVHGDGTYTSPSLTPSTAGTYQWVASYSGDANNVALPNVGCGDLSETVKIVPPPALSTSATPATTLIGGSITDVATLTGGLSPTGTITWKLYGPADDSCTGTPQTTAAVTVTGDGAYTSPALTPTQLGTYHWVASYSGDAHNPAINNVGCSDPAETVQITSPPPVPKVQPSLVTSATPGSTTQGGSVTDIAVLSGGNAPTGTITWSLYGPNDTTCTGTPQTTSAVAVNGAGNYTSPALTVSAAGTYHWVATYSGDTNNLAAGPVGCTDPAEAVTVSPPSTSSFTLVKSQSLTSTGGFTTAPITAQIGQTIYYQIVVTNTGNTPLALALVDTMCTSIAGPTGNIAGGDLQVGGTATYTCLHVVVAADFPTYVNVAQVTATPPGGPPLPPQRSSVLANIPKAVVAPCVTSKTTLTQTIKTLSSKKTSTTKAVKSQTKTQTKTVTTKNQLITAILSDPNHGTDIKKVVFSLDGRPIKTLTKPNLSGGRFRVQVKTASTRYGAHRITAAVTMICGPAQTNNVSFMHALPAIKVVPHFTG